MYGSTTFGHTTRYIESLAVFIKNNSILTFMKQKKITNLFLVLLLLLISIFAPVVPAADEPTNLEMESTVLNGANGFNVSWDIGLGADHTILVYKKDSSPTSVNNGYKYFYDNSITSSNFTGVFCKGLGYNENYFCRGYSGENPFSKVTRTIEDGVNLTFMDNRSHLPDPFFSVDSSSKVNGTRSININNPSISDSSIYGIRHFESSHALDVFSMHCRMDDKSGTDDKTLSITPYSQDYAITNASFYFNSYSGGLVWNDADQIVDGRLNRWGYSHCAYPVAVQLLDGNNCTGANPGPISKVEMRANIGYNADPNPNIIIRPIMPNGLDGNDHEYTATFHYNVGGAWTEWFDITNDDNAPVWSWEDIQNLDCELENNCSGDSYILCSQVEILVSYIQGYIPYPEVAFYDNASTRIDEFYFNSYNTSEAWETNPENMVDGDSNTYAWTDINYDIQHLNETTCQGIDFGDITKVELMTKFTGDHVNAAEHVLSRIHLRPVFSGGDGDNHTFLTEYITTRWTEWVDITSDTNAPAIWSWSNVTNLDCDVEFQKFYAHHRMFCYVVQIRVTSFSNVTAGDSDLLDSWETDRVYNLTWSRYTSAINVTINDYLGNSSYANISTAAGSVDGFIINMGRSATRDVYLDEWNEVDCTVSAGSSSTSNSTYPDAPTNFTVAGTFSTLVPLSWDASDTWDQVLIRKSTSTYPSLPSDGDNAYFGPGTSTSDVVVPATTTYYSAFGYDNETGVYSVNHVIVKHISSQLRAFFSFSPSPVRQGEQIQFSDLSSGDIVSWIWNFGDGHTAIGRNQEHTFDTPGRYTVSLTITDAGNYVDKCTKSIAIALFEEPNIPPPVEPIYPEGHSVSDMYSVLKVSDLPVSDNKIRIVLIDTGYTPRTYNEVDLGKISGYSLPRFSSSYDDNGHGTFVSYEIAHIVQSKCPNSDIISFKAFDQYGAATPEDFIAAMDAVKKMKPDIVSISAGTIGNPNDIYSKKVQELRESGIIVISAAAGNLGPAPSTILSPACSDYAIAVGSFDTQGTIDTSDDTISTWSSRGPVLDISPKPDIVAPGESIAGPWLLDDTVSSGTSMSTPLIAGGTALVIANNKPLVDTAKVLYFWNLGVIGDAFENALIDGCIYKGEPDAWGAGIPDFTKVNDNFRFNLLVLIFLPIVLIVSIISVSAVVLYKRRKDNGLSW